MNSVLEWTQTHPHVTTPSSRIVIKGSQPNTRDHIGYSERKGDLHTVICHSCLQRCDSI